MDEENSKEHGQRRVGGGVGGGNEKRFKRFRKSNMVFFRTFNRRFNYIVYGFSSAIIEIMIATTERKLLIATGIHWRKKDCFALRSCSFK